jgi:hypothetical protein
VAVTPGCGGGRRVRSPRRPPCIADDLADACALTEALLRSDAEAVETLLKFGDPVGIALVAAGWLAVALGRLDGASAAVILDGWRRDAEGRRGSCWPG